MTSKHRSTSHSHDTTMAEPGRRDRTHRAALDAAIAAERESTLGLAERRSAVADAAVQAGLATLGVGPAAAAAGADLLGLTPSYERPTEAEITTRASARVEAGKASDIDTEIHRLRIQSERKAVRASAALALGAMVDKLLASED